MRVVFYDTNVIYGLIVRHLTGKEIAHSSLFLFAQNNEVYISDFVLKELKINLKENENIELLNNDIANFIALSNFKVMQSNILRSEFVRYVEDFEDAQILQDAFDIRADYILTQNLKDFDIQGIGSVFKIQVIGKLPL